MSEYILVFITAASVQEAETLAHAAVEQRLAACGNIIPDIRSVFWWNNRIDTEQETLLILKSKAALFPAIVDLITTLHRYEVPEIIALPILAGSEKYLTWLERETQASETPR